MKRYNQKEIGQLVEILKNEGVISVPTDTVYGLCASMNSVKAYKKLIQIKHRPTTKFLPVMCSDEEQIKSIAYVYKKSEKLIKRFMPGPITLILKKKPKLPDFVNTGVDTIAIRMATSEILRDLINKLGCPIFLSSANQSGEPTCTNLDEIEKACPDLDGMLEGDVSFGKSSTIVDCTNEKINILRIGPISIEEINETFEI